MVISMKKGVHFIALVSCINFLFGGIEFGNRSSTLALGEDGLTILHVSHPILVDGGTVRHFQTHEPPRFSVDNLYGGRYPVVYNFTKGARLGIDYADFSVNGQLDDQGRVLMCVPFAIGYAYPSFTSTADVDCPEIVVPDALGESFVGGVVDGLVRYNTRTVGSKIQIELQDSLSRLELGLRSNNMGMISLNGGALYLLDDLSLSTTAFLGGGGTVFGQGNKITFGSELLSWPEGVIHWLYETHINLVGNVRLQGRWNFGQDFGGFPGQEDPPGEDFDDFPVPEGPPLDPPLDQPLGPLDHNYLNGNGNVLDLSTGKICVNPFTRLVISNVKIKGLNVTNNGTADAVSNFELGVGAEVIFNRVELEMDTDWTVTSGGIYVSGSSTIVNKNHMLTFDLGSSLTVDGCALWYDTLVYSDNNGIKPFEEDDPNHNILTLLNNGQIKHITSYQAGTVLINETFPTRSPVQLRSPELTLRSLTPANSATYDLADVRDLSPAKPYAVNVNAIINGNTNTINFAKTTSPVIKVKAGKTLTFQDIALNNFKFSHVSLGAASHVIFGDGTDILWGANYALTQTMTFQGECKLDGNGKTITLSRFGGFEVAPDSSLLLQNITIKGLTKNHLRCLDDTAAISFGGKVKLCLSDDLFFDEGHFEIMPAALLDVRGTESFIYRSDQQSFINSGGTFQLSGGAIFSYEPRSNNHDLIVFNDEDANLKLNRGALASTTTGMRLTSGTLQIAGPKNYIRAADIASPTISESIVFGDGVDVMKNLSVEFSNGKLTLETGALIWANVEDNL